MKKIKIQNGITLVSLIITIIVLLILSVAVIRAVQGKGIVTKAFSAKKEFEIASIIEEIKLDIINKESKNMGSLTEEEIYSILEKYGNISNDNMYITTTKGNHNIPISSICYDYIEPTNKWIGKTAVFVGDSITYGTGVEDGEEKYWELLKEKLSLSTVTEMGIAGSCISSKSDYGSKYTPLIDRYNTIPEADLITIFMGTNDYGHETPLGNIEDETDISFYGALNVVVSSLVQKFPSSRIVFVTPLHRYGFGTSKITGEAFTYDNLNNGVNANLEDYVNAIKEVCAKYSVSVIDMYTISKLDPSDAAVKEEYMPDGLHPNAAGHKILAKELANEFIWMRPADYIEEDTTYKIKIILGNKYSKNYVDLTNRASIIKNVYLEAGTVVSLKDSATYKYGMYEQDSETVAVINGTDNKLVTGGWITDNYTIEADGWYGIALTRVDNADFDFESADSLYLSDYLKFE